MKFIITRASCKQVDDTGRPCEEAFLDSLPYIDEYDLTEEEYDAMYSFRWREHGTNHIVTEEGYIQRTLDLHTPFVVELNTFEELLEFSKKYGELVFSTTSSFLGAGSIEIYDDYKE